MSKIAFTFLGQGTQICGIGQDFYEQTETEERTFDKAIELMGSPMPQLCPKENDGLDIMEYTQAAMITASIVMMRVLEENGIKPDVAAGFSLGEYCVLATAGVISDEDAIRTVYQKGILTWEAVPVGEGTMTAILAPNASAIEEVIGAVEGAWIASCNYSGQVVISGEKVAMEDACGKLKAAGARRAVMLDVSGPYLLYTSPSPRDIIL